MSQSLKIAVIGYGYWGPNLVRNFSWIKNCVVQYVCDLQEKQLQQAKEMFPNVVSTTSNYKQILQDPEVDAIAIATPVNTHFTLAKEALEFGKHVLVEKPMTDSIKTAVVLNQIAEKNKLVLMVDHTFLFTGAVKKIKELIESNAIGEIYYFDSTRVNLGLFQSDINVIWDLAPHDFSILRYVIPKKPVSIQATGIAHVNSGLENIAYITVYYDDNTLAHFHVNWLSPIKVRQILIGGSEKMIVFDDMENTEKIKVYDKGIDLQTASKKKLYETLIQYRTGDMYAPKLDSSEALKLECEHFLDCIRKQKKPVNDGDFGIEVVKMLESSQVSIKNQGKIVGL